MSELAAFFAHLQKQCLPGVWSKGMTLSREGAVELRSRTATEIILSVRQADRPVSPKITLWPEDDDAYCDCGDRNEICSHIAACVLALKSGALASPDTPAAGTGATRVLYRLKRQGSELRLERALEARGRETPLTDTLVATAGGIGSGRLDLPALSATREDFEVDAALGAPPAQAPSRSAWARIFRTLHEHPGVTLDGQAVTLSRRPVGLRAFLDDSPGGGLRLWGEMEPRLTEIFTNGAALCGTRLHPLQVPALNHELAAALTPQGRGFKTPEQLAMLLTEWLPTLESQLPLEIRAQRLPIARPGQPKIRLRLGSEQGLVVAGSIEYPDPLGPDEVLIKDPARELELRKQLKHELHLSPDQAVRLSGPEALEFMLKLKGPAASQWLITGADTRDFALVPRLSARFVAEADGFSLGFSDPSGTRAAEPSAVLRAWSEGADFVPLIGGGWAPLPRDWLARFGPRIAALLEARGAQARLAPHMLPNVAELAAEMGTALPESLRLLCARLEGREIPAAPLPQDLGAELRDYQRQGVDWLCWLRDSGMGALLADDMGLGKTLQALCAVRGRTLVICPTSVLSAWSAQIDRFRPALKTSVYHGASRELDSAADITLTTYALLRLDQHTLADVAWDTVILDEAQTIKNASSQVARAAHQLRASFRVALSGTPIENRLEDLYSQFQFVNPGLLGSPSTFRAEFAQAPERLRARVRPFLLRRLKKDVASELPPRTEIVLHCELTESERELYDSILLASRGAVLEKLEHEGGVFAALETLLRLRQACCHPALVPGAGHPPSSSKLELLTEQLRESTALGHRALVFSQWTSHLDLIEPALRQSGLGFLRLDGATNDRARIVDAFQSSDGPPVLLISLKAGGVGVTLTAADHIYLMDPWWNPAVEDQAADRAHRIGQTNPVLIHRLVARDTVEDRILALQKRKLELAGSVLEGSAQAASLTREDLLGLLS